VGGIDLLLWPGDMGTNNRDKDAGDMDVAVLMYHWSFTA
jgi:hypothetical protein